MRHITLCLCMTLSTCCAALLCAGGAREVSAAPAPLKKNRELVTNIHPEWLCGRWDMEWRFCDLGSVFIPNYEAEFRSDGSYSCRDVSSEKWNYVGTWKLHISEIAVKERYYTQPEDSVDVEFTISPDGATKESEDYSSALRVRVRRSIRVTD